MRTSYREVAEIEPRYFLASELSRDAQIVAWLSTIRVSVTAINRSAAVAEPDVSGGENSQTDALKLQEALTALAWNSVPRRGPFGDSSGW